LWGYLGIIPSKPELVNNLFSGYEIIPSHPLKYPRSKQGLTVAARDNTGAGRVRNKDEPGRNPRARVVFRQRYFVVAQGREPPWLHRELRVTDPVASAAGASPN
jgi:hypothetical protein